MAYREIVDGVSHLYDLARRLTGGHSMADISDGDFATKLLHCFEPHSNLLTFTSDNLEVGYNFTLNFLCFLSFMRILH